MTASLQAEGLQRAFGQRHVVRGAGLVLQPAEFVVLIGPSGCGKTTLLQMLGLLDRPDAGRVEIGGVDGWALAPAARGQLRLAALGFVFQQHNLLSHLSARDNVALPLWRLRGERRAALREADALLERFGLRQRAADHAAQLSLGEAQRVAIARALINRPQVVLADEPTGSLDSAAAALVIDALQEVREHGVALLLSTHDQRLTERAGRVLTMLDGQLR